MRRLCAGIAALSLLGASSLASAADAKPAAEPQVEFVVIKSDTLISLSRDVLVSPAAWREVATLNRLANPNRITAGQVLRIPIRLMRATPRQAVLVSSAGDVRIGDVAAAAGQPLADGQTVQTGAASSAVLELADGTRVRMPPSSLAQIVGSESYGVRPAAGGAAGAAPSSGGWFSGALRVMRGSVEVFATKVLRAKPLEVITPTAVVGVRGTQFRVGLEDDATASTHSEVIEGKTRFDTASRSAGADVANGFGAAADVSAKPPQVVALLDAPDLSSVPALFERPIVHIELPNQANDLRVQVAADNGFERIVSDQRFEAGKEIRIAGLDDAQWHLRARRIDGAGIEGFDAARPFTLKARPEPPVYRTPRADGKQTVGAVEFAWARNTTAPRVRIQVAEDAGFTRMVVDRDAVADTTLRADVSTPGIYFWRLASIRDNGDHGPFGDTQRFELRPMPATPSGRLAADGKSMIFKWSGRPQDRQEVQLARDAAFTRISAQATLDTAEWAVPAPGSGHYFFRYRSIEPDGFIGPYSDPVDVNIPVDWTPMMLLAPLLLF